MNRKLKFSFIVLAALLAGNSVLVAADTVTPLTYTYTPDNSTTSYTIYFYLKDNEAVICNKVGYIGTTYNTTNVSEKNYYAGDITIPEKVKSESTEYSVTAIAPCAFARCSTLTSVVLPETITSIGGYAFQSCSTLATVNIPDNVTSIETQTFYQCYSLKEIEIPEGVTYIRGSAFYKCTTLTNLTIPKNVTEIFAYAFGGCTALEWVKIYAPSLLSYYSAFHSGSSTITSFKNKLKIYVLPYSLATYKSKWDSYVSSDYTDLYPFVDRTISANGASTLALPFPATIPDGVTAYNLKYYSSDPDVATAVSVETIAKDEPVYITGTGSTTYSFLGSSTDAVTDSTSTSAIKESLVGNYLAACLTVPNNGNCYVLQNGVFKKVATDNIKIGQFKAYLDISKEASSSAEYLSIVFSDEDESTDIASVATTATDSDDEAIYSLQGLRMSGNAESLPSGIYIRKGKKFIVK